MCAFSQHIGRHDSHGYWNGFSCSSHCLWTHISNTRLVKTFLLTFTTSPEFSKKRHNKHDLNPSNLQAQRSPLVSFLRVSGKLLLSPLAWSPSPTALGTLLIRRRSVVCSICSFPIASTSHSSKPFHFLSAFGAITNRWALVICCTLHCQQRSQDKWLTSSIAWRTWDCTSRFTQLFQRWQFALFVFFALFEKGPLDLLASVCSKKHFLVKLQSYKSFVDSLFIFHCALMGSRHADIVCLRSHLNMCVCPTALPTAQRPPTMTSGCCCDSHRGWRTRELPISCRTGHVTPGSGIAVTSKTITQNRFH